MESVIHTILYLALNERKALCEAIFIPPPARSEWFSCLGTVMVAHAAFSVGLVFFLTSQQLRETAPVCSCTLSKQLALRPKILRGITWKILDKKMPLWVAFKLRPMKSWCQSPYSMPLCLFCMAPPFVSLRERQSVCTMALRSFWLAPVDHNHGPLCHCIPTRSVANASDSPGTVGPQCFLLVYTQCDSHSVGQLHALHRAFVPLFDLHIKDPLCHSCQLLLKYI